MPKIPTIESIPVPEVMGGMQVKFVDAASQLSTVSTSIVTSDATGNLLKSVSGFLPEGFKTIAEFETSFFAKRDKLITVKTNQIEEIKRQQREVSVPAFNSTAGLPSEGTGDIQKDALAAQQGFSNLSKELGSLFSASSINSSVSKYTSKLNTDLAAAQKELETDLAELKAINEAPKSSDNSNHHLALYKDFLPR